MSHDHDHVKSLVLRAVKGTPSFPRISIRNLHVFCTDIGLVALGFRTAYLLDLFTVSEDIARRFSTSLRQEDPVFRNVLLVFHVKLEQVFFVNPSLLQDRYAEARSATPWTSFIYLTPDLPDTLDPLPEIGMVSQIILKSWIDQSLDFHTCISSLSDHQMIALAGYLLEYPVSYYPVASSEDSVLRDTPLDVYECILIPSTSEFPRHIFMKFSRPAASDGSSIALANRIQERFKQRLSQLQSKWKEIRVTCESRTLDRVAL